jgi:dihydroxyacid dehydratase/phosphogluconate dehydratase
MLNGTTGAGLAGKIRTGNTVSLHKHRSRIVTNGLARAPHRAFLRATGLDDSDLEKSFVGIVTTSGENTPCSMPLLPQADRCRLGVAAGGGVPISLSTISISDGTSMNHAGMRMSLPSRELIADSVEIALLRDGDVIVIDGEAATLSVRLLDEELQFRRGQWKPPARRLLAGALEKYERLVGPAHEGAVTHSGSVEWPYNE